MALWFAAVTTGTSTTLRLLPAAGASIPASITPFSMLPSSSNHHLDRATMQRHPRRQDTEGEGEGEATSEPLPTRYHLESSYRVVTDLVVTLGTVLVPSSPSPSSSSSSAAANEENRFHRYWPSVIEHNELYHRVKIALILDLMAFLDVPSDELVALFSIAPTAGADLATTATEEEDAESYQDRRVRIIFGLRFGDDGTGTNASLVQTKFDALSSTSSNATWLPTTATAFAESVIALVVEHNNDKDGESNSTSSRTTTIVAPQALSFYVHSVQIRERGTERDGQAITYANGGRTTANVGSAADTHYPTTSRGSTCGFDCALGILSVLLILSLIAFVVVLIVRKRKGLDKKGSEEEGDESSSSASHAAAHTTTATFSITATDEDGYKASNHHDGSDAAVTRDDGSKSTLTAVQPNAAADDSSTSKKPEQQQSTPSSSERDQDLLVTSASDGEEGTEKETKGGAGKTHNELSDCDE